MEEELISIIVPVYNIEDYIHRCVKSIINQTYDNIEILLIDDGSTDKSGEICDEFKEKDTRIKVFHKENGGLSDARNYGIKNSTGKYITTIDGDDYVDFEYIENLYKLLINNSADISSINRYDFLENQANGIIKKVEYYNNAPETTIYSSDEYLREILKDKLPHEAWAKLYKKEIFEKNEYEKGLKIYEDLEFLVRVLENKNLKIVCNTGIFGYYYRRRNDSLMTSKYNEYWEKELQYYIDLMNNDDYLEYNKYLKKLLEDKIFRNYNKIIEQNEKYEKTKFLQECAEYLKINECKKLKSKFKIFLLKYFPIVLYIIFKIIVKKRQMKYKKFKYCK